MTTIMCTKKILDISKLNKIIDNIEINKNTFLLINSKTLQTILQENNKCGFATNDKKIYYFYRGIKIALGEWLDYGEIKII